MKEKEEYWENKRNKIVKKEKIKDLRTNIKLTNKILVSMFKKIVTLKKNETTEENSSELEKLESDYENYLLRLNNYETMLINIVRNKYDSYSYRFIPSKIKLK